MAKTRVFAYVVSVFIDGFGEFVLLLSVILCTSEQVIICVLVNTQKHRHTDIHLSTGYTIILGSLANWLS